jgi:hypothetical protein
VALRESGTGDAPDPAHVRARAVDSNPAWMWRLDLRSMEEQAEVGQILRASGALRRTPDTREMYAAGPEAFLEGWLPPEPPIRRDTRVIAFGSCLAARFVEWLAEHGYNRKFRSDSDESIVRSPLETPLAVAQQFRWAFGEMDSEHAFWVGPDKQRVAASEERRVLLHETLASVDVLIITLGISEVWYDTVSGEPLWRVPTRTLHATGRYEFKVASAAETLEALETIHRLRTEHMPDVKILYTVSPQRHGATFRSISPIVANTVTKAILRVAVDEFLRAHADELNETYFYFPGYELVTELLRDPFMDNMHLRDHHAEFVLDLFARFYTDANVPLSEQSRFPASAEDELHETVAVMHVQNKALQAVCDERLAVIEELDAACGERLRVIEELSGELGRITSTRPGRVGFRLPRRRRA